MAGKFGPNEVFIIAEEEDPINLYHSNTIMQTNDNEDEVEVATKLLNIARTFQGVSIIIPTRAECPSSPTPCYYLELPCNLTTLATNPKLVVNLKDH